LVELADLIDALANENQRFIYGERIIKNKNYEFREIKVCISNHKNNKNFKNIK